MTLNELADRVEAASGADHALDVLIWNAVFAASHNRGETAPLPQHNSFTASLDAARTVAPVGCGYRIEYHPELAYPYLAYVWTHENAEPGDGWFSGRSRVDPAPALVAAALRARGMIVTVETDTGQGAET